MFATAISLPIFFQGHVKMTHFTDILFVLYWLPVVLVTFLWLYDSNAINIKFMVESPELGLEFIYLHSLDGFVC